MKFFITFCFIALCAINLINAENTKNSESPKSEETSQQQEGEKHETGGILTKDIPKTETASGEENTPKGAKEDRKGGGKGGAIKAGRGRVGIKIGKVGKDYKGGDEEYGGLPDPTLEDYIELGKTVAKKLSEGATAAAEWVKGAAKKIAGWFGK